VDDENRSGNRWEPQDGHTQPLQAQGEQAGQAEAPAPEPAVGTAVLPPPGETDIPHSESGVPPRSTGRDWTGWRDGPRRPWVLGIAAAVLMLVTGVGGFLIGRTTAPEGFDGDGHPGLGPGQGPGQGFDRDSDDGQGFPPPPGSGTDSRSGSDGSDGTADTTLYVVRSAG